MSSCHFKIRTMRPGDAAAAVRLTEPEQWNFTSGDFRVMMRLWPKGNFVIENESGSVAGIGSVITHGKLSWLSNFVVAKKERGKGYGVALVERALEQGAARGAEYTGLYTYDDRVGFYYQFGFKNDGAHTAYTGRIRVTAGLSGTKSAGHIFAGTKGDASDDESVVPVKPVTPGMIGDIISLDRKAFGRDRSVFLKTLFKHADRFIAAGTGGGVSGYLAADPTADGGFEVSQWVAKSPQNAGALIAALSRNVKGRPLWLLVPDGNRQAVALVRKPGLRPGRKYMKMFRGKRPARKKAGWVYTVGGLEVW